jgi:processive 1,2-diacylglycerol beta-glucosyltransferase
MRRPNGIDVIFIDGGGAHRSVARSLAAALRASNPESDVRVINAAEIFDRHFLLGKIVRLGVWLYNRGLRWERMWNLSGFIRLGLALFRRPSAGTVTRLAGFWSDDAPRVLVSTIPVFNDAIALAVRRNRADAVYVTIPVDFEECQPGFWFDRRCGSYNLCANDRLIEQARHAGIPGERIASIPGMITDPRFGRAGRADVASQRRALGLDPGFPTVLISFGGQGSKLMMEIAQRLDAAPRPANLIVLCGHHSRLRDALKSRVFRNPVLTLGYTEDVATIMRISDVLIGKPGPITISEAVESGLPMVLWENPGLKILLEYNVRWVRQHGVGVAVGRLDEIVPAVQELLADPGYRNRALALRFAATARSVEIIQDMLLLPQSLPERADEKPVVVGETLDAAQRQPAAGI